MKKPKTVKPFYYKDITHEQFVDIVNSELPISLKYNEDLVNRIHNKYPLINKAEVAIVIKNIFEALRDFLIAGKVLNFNNILFDAKLNFFDYRRGGRILPALRVKIRTPPRMRKL